VHILLALSSVILVTLGSYLILRSLRHLGDWSQRREMQCFVLLMPVVSLGLGLLGLHHFSGRACLRGAPSWDSLLGMGLPLLMGLIALGALCLGILRLALMTQVLRRKSMLANPELQLLADNLAGRLGAAQPDVRLCIYDRPLAFTYGLRRPQIVLSTWMIDHLDRREFEAVLAHELEHVARRDYLVIWLATLLRDAFFYLPTSRTAYRQLQKEKELACDDLAISVTHRPLALASALTKVWQHAVSGCEADFAQARTVQAFTGGGETIHIRVERLLVGSKPPVSAPRSRQVVSRISILSFIGLLIFEAVSITLILASMGCGPAILLGKLF
jgi:Zn-dependent protease with chaperone function